MNEKSRKALEDYMRVCVCACLGRPSDFMGITVEVDLVVCDTSRTLKFYILLAEPLDSFDRTILERMLKDFGFGSLFEEIGLLHNYLATAYVGDFVESAGRFWDFATETYKRLPIRKTSRVAPVRVPAEAE